MIFPPFPFFCKLLPFVSNKSLTFSTSKEIVGDHKSNLRGEGWKRVGKGWGLKEELNGGGEGWKRADLVGYPQTEKRQPDRQSLW